MSGDTEKLFMPFNSKPNELKGIDQNLSKEDRAIQTFPNKGIYIIIVILVSLGVMVSSTIYLGFFYELVYSKGKISKEADLISSGLTTAQAVLTREEQRTALKEGLKFNLEIAGYVLGAFGIIIAIWFFSSIWYWKGVSLPELTRENIIGRDISYAMKTGNAVDNISSLLAYHVHPNASTSRTTLQTNLGKNFRNAMQAELTFPKGTIRQMYNPS